MGDRNSEVPHHTEDKEWWYLHGEQLEKTFVDLCQTKLELSAQINPEKAHDNTAPDLVVDGVLADLKTQNTPFFTAGRYGIDPRFAVTFNRKDYERYRKLYPEIVIYFWLDWKQTQWKDIRVDYLGRIARLPFSDVASLIENGAPEHRYIHRRQPGDTNAKSSFVLDIEDFETLFNAKA